jgi:hypothetical protein
MEIKTQQDKIFSKGRGGSCLVNFITGMHRISGLCHEIFDPNFFFFHENIHRI